MEDWQRAWREGYAPHLSTKALQALSEALAKDDPELMQGATTCPAPIFRTSDWDVRGACAIGFCGWKGQGLDKVGQVCDYFAQACKDADGKLGFTGAGRMFLNWFDDTPRAEMIPKLKAEVDMVLETRLVKELPITQKAA